METMTMERSATNRRAHLAFQALVGVAVMTTVIVVAPAKADECGVVSCTDITSDYIVPLIENVMKGVGTDCRSVRAVRLLDKSVDNIMMIYDVRCDDGAGVQQYQLMYWVRDREVIADKFSGSWMTPKTKKYRNSIGLEER